MAAERVFLQAGSLSTPIIFLHYILLITTNHKHGNCSKAHGAVDCFLWEGQVVSRKAEVNLRLSGPEAD